jgi:quercetin dioxygenase-like cupin family protein
MDRTPADLSRRDAAVRLGGGALAALLLAAGLRGAGAQDATPGATGGATGTTAHLLGGGQPAAAPGLELTLRRIVHVPGARVPAHAHPGTLIIWVEAGSWGYTPLGGSARITRAGVTAPAATPGSQPFGGTEAATGEELPLGAEVILTAGDWLFVEDPEDDVRNAGDDDVVLLVAGLTRVGEAFTSFFNP